MKLIISFKYLFIMGIKYIIDIYYIYFYIVLLIPLKNSDISLFSSSSPFSLSLLSSLV